MIMRKNGFTLVELLCILVIMGLLLAIAVPNALKMSGKVKNKAYTTKVELIEKAAVSFGQSNMTMVRKGIDFKDSTKNHTCTFSYSGDKVSSVVFNTRTYSEGASLINTGTKKEFWCTRVNVEDLVKTNDIDYDYKDQCGDKCSNATDKANYNNIIINPKSEFIINKCFIYVYYRNNRVYAYFDQERCNNRSDVPNNDGREYRPITGK